MRLRHQEPMAAAFASIFSDSIKQSIDAVIVLTEEGAAARFNSNLSVFQLLDKPTAVRMSID